MVAGQFHGLEKECPRVAISNDTHLTPTVAVGTRLATPFVTQSNLYHLFAVTTWAHLHMTSCVLGHIFHHVRELIRHPQQTEEAHVIGIDALDFMEADVEFAQ